MKWRIVPAAWLVAVVAAAPAWALPDLTISLPSQPGAGQVAPVYVDAFQVPGRLLYRFDSLIVNEGSTLDLYRDEASGHVMQALWDSEPSSEPDPDSPPAGVPLSDRTEAGARIDYVSEGTHDHFHFFTAARYELEVPGAPTRVSDKIGFCLFDSFDGAGGTIQWFRPDRPWCHAPAGHAGFARMGLSPGGADRYASQREFQYVDVTGLAPGPYVLRGTANPEGHVLESDGMPDVMSETRVIPGVVADPLSADARGPVAIPLSARAVAPEIPARRSGDCTARATAEDCYARSDGTLRFAAGAAAHGTVSVSGAEAIYTPAPGFSGDDAFSYTATDARGLESAPARVTVHVTAAVPAPVPAIAPPRRLLAIVAARRVARRALVVRIRCRAAAAGACAGRITARTRARRLASRRFSEVRPGRARTLRLRLARVPRGAITVRATVRDARGAGRAVTRRATGPRGSQ